MRSFGKGADTTEDEVLKTLTNAVRKCAATGAAAWDRRAVEGGIRFISALSALTAAPRQVEEDSGEGKCVLPEHVDAAGGRGKSHAVCGGGRQEERIKKSECQPIVRGTVSGDIHNG